MPQNYNMGQKEKVSIIKNWLSREGLLTDEKQEACNNKKGSFNTFNKNLSQYNETIKFLQFC